MKVDLMYSVQYIPHPWDMKMREKGIKAYCLCREVRLLPEMGDVRGKTVGFDPVAIFNLDSEGELFEEFCHREIDQTSIELRDELLSIKEACKKIRESRK